MWYDNFREKIVNLEAEEERIQIEGFLKRQNLSLDQQIDYTVALLDGDKLVATGSLDGRILKCIAVDEGYQNMGLSSKLVTHLTREACSRGVTHLFIYTKPENKIKFSDLGFYPIAEVPAKVVLLENRPAGVKNYLKKILQENEESHRGDLSGAIIINANPFTLGHQYLIEFAASNCETLHLFVLQEDKSSFPTEIRYRLVKEGVKHLSNVVVHMGKDYVISDATFPSYFIKKYQKIVETHARLDLELFTRYIAPRLGIKKRFVGQEPYCKVTATYNLVMQEVLPAHGIEVQVVPRLENQGQPISASRVRELIRERKIHEVNKLVPETTYQFLLSPEAEGIIQTIIKDDKRH
jgi:[citrate (pro-3S)-lyase] ligase